MFASLRRLCAANPRTSESGLHQLALAWQQIGPSARKVLLEVAEGLRRGSEYGDFQNVLQDMESEGLEELRDALIYFTVEVQRRRAARRG